MGNNKLTIHLRNLRIGGILLTMFLLFSTHKLHAQRSEEKFQVAEAYFEKGDYEKALLNYEDLVRKSDYRNKAYEHYRICLIELKQTKDLEKFLKKQVKSEPENLSYQVDYVLAQRMNGSGNFEKDIDKLIDENKKNPLAMDDLAEAFMHRGMVDQTIQLFLVARKQEREDTRYAEELALLYEKKGQKKEMVNELMNLLQGQPQRIEEVQNRLQVSLDDEEDYEMLVSALYEGLKADPKSLVYPEMLVWYHLQQNDFQGAFPQARSLDKRKMQQGEEMMKIGEMAMKHGDYNGALLYFNYVAQGNYAYNRVIQARKRAIDAREMQVRNTYPPDLPKILALSQEYENLLVEARDGNQRLEIQRKIALLRAFYLGEYAEGIKILERALDEPRASNRSKAEAKLELGDVYLFKGVPWQSALLYAQVEKDFKDSPIAHEAKLRGAKLSYFTGDFELAKAHLDVLKLATTREIANDALALSLLIQDNLALDTVKTTMSQYARADLLVYQGKLDPALVVFDSLLAEYPNHSLVDETQWQRASIFMKKGQYQQAFEAYDYIASKYKRDILTDDALFASATLLEEHLGDKSQAMERYKKILMEFAGSVHVAEARKRYRKLRGDKNQ